MTFKPRLGTLPIIIFLVILTCSQAQRSSVKQHFCLEPCLCHGDRISCRDADLEEVPLFVTINGAHIVDLSKNNILAVDRHSFAWGGTIQLQFLYLSVNAIVYVESGAFDDLLNLEHVDLSNNELQYVPVDIVAENGRMRVLNLAQNMLVHEVPTISSDSLQVLDLSWNKLDTILPETFTLLPNLERLELQSNNFRYISTETFIALPNLMYIDLNINAWACNCDSQRLFEFVTARGLFNATAPIICRQNDKSTSEIYLQDEIAAVSSNFCYDDNETNPNVLLLGDDPTVVKTEINITVNDVATIVTVNDLSDMTANDPSDMTANDPSEMAANDPSDMTANDPSDVTANDPSDMAANDLSDVTANDPLIKGPSILTADDVIAPSPKVDDVESKEGSNSTITRKITIYHFQYSLLNIMNLMVFIVLMVFVAKMLVMCVDVCKSLSESSNTEESLLYKGTQMQIV